MQPSLSSASPEESKDDVFATITNIVGTTSGGTADGGGGGVDEDASGESASKRIKRTRNRRPASCENCRKKKMRCDRLYVWDEPSVLFSSLLNLRMRGCLPVADAYAADATFIPNLHETINASACLAKHARVEVKKINARTERERLPCE